MQKYRAINIGKVTATADDCLIESEAETISDALAHGARAAKPVPVAQRAGRLTGPAWRDAWGNHAIHFELTNCTGRWVWRVVDMCDGLVFQVLDIPARLDGVCDTLEGALWAVRGVAASWMRSDVRSTRGH